MQTHFKFPSMLRLKNETPAVQAALLGASLAIPLALGAALGWAWWRHSSAKPARGGAWLRRLVAGMDAETAGGELLRFIHDSLIGLDKSAVRNLLGDPSAAAEEGAIFAHPPRARQALADHWYYRLDRLRRPRQPGSALMVAFDEDDQASDAKFLLSPQ